MKRILTLLLTLASMLAGTSAWAASYDLWVGNVQITDSNKSDINPTGKTAGKIWFENNGTLHFKSVTMTAPEGYACINNTLSDGLTVVFEGSNCLTSTGAANTVYSKTELTLKGSTWDDPATVVINSNPDASMGYAAIYINSTEDLNIFSLYLTAKSTGKYGIAGNTGSLYTSTSDVSATGGQSAVSNFSNWSMLDYGMLYGGDTYKPANKAVIKSDGTVAATCTLKNGLYVGRAMPRLTGNLSSITPTGLSQGTISWDGSAKKLTLNGVKYTSDGWAFVHNFNVNNLIIETTAASTITCNGVNAFIPRTNTTFTGTAKLTAKGYNGISVYGNTTVTLAMNATASFEGEYCGYYGDHSESKSPDCDLVIRKAGASSDYYFKGGNACIKTISHLNLDEMDFFYNDTYGIPGCYFDESTNNVKKAGGAVAAGDFLNFYRVGIYYPIFVAGKQLNDCNSVNPQAFGSPYLTAGTVAYNATTKTLTLENVRMDASADDNIEGIKTGQSAGNITIEFAGNNDQVLKTSNVVLDLSSNTSIVGTSKVILNSTMESGISTRSDASITIATSKFLEISGAKYAYWGCGSLDEKLTLRKETSDLSAYRFVGEQGIIHNVKELVFDNMDFFHGYSSANHEDGYLDGCYFSSGELRENGGSIAKGRIAFGSIQEKLPVFVCGKQLNKTSSNSNYTIYVGSPYIKSGALSVGYNPFNNTLTLDNANVNFSEDDNRASVQTLADNSITLDLKGDNKLSGNFAGLWLRSGYHAFEGDGTLKLTGSECGCYLAYGSSLNIRDNVTVEASGTEYGGIWSNVDYNYPSLTVSGDATVKASTISGIGSLTLADDHFITEPAGAVFDSEAREVRAGGATAQDIVIRKGELYSIEICGVVVNEFNCDDILGDGSFRYDPDAKTLTILNADINDTSIANAICNVGVDDLIIDIEGENYINVQDDIFVLRRNTVFIGSGSLEGTLAANDGYGIFMLGSTPFTCTLNGPTFTFTGQYAVVGENCTLAVTDGLLLYVPNENINASPLYVASLELGEAIYITEPEGGFFSGAMKAVTLDGTNPYNGPMVIEKVGTVELWIADKQVDDYNCYDVLGDGMFRYDDASKTLFISGDYEYLGSGNVVDSHISGLTIKVISNSTITSKSANPIIRLHAPATITGGVLTLKCTRHDKDGKGIFTDGGLLHFDLAHVEVVGDGFEYGITGDPSCDLIIEYSDITATAHNYGAIYDWKSITLIGSNIVEPESYQVLSYGIADGTGTIVGSSAVSGTVVILLDAVGISDVESSTEADEEIYDVSGRKLDRAGHGVSIVRDKEGNTRKILRK